MSPATRRPNPGIHRVYYVDESLRGQVKKGQAERGQPLREFLTAAVDAYLPRVLEGLSGLGLRRHGEARRPARWPMTDGVLAKLRDASSQTGLDQTALLFARNRTASRTRRPGR